MFGNLSVLDNVLIGAHTRLRAVRPLWPLLGAPAELALALIRPRAVRAEEQALRAEALDILALFGERLLPGKISRPTAFPTPIGGVWRSPARWRCGHGYCCWMSRPPA